MGAVDTSYIHSVMPNSPGPNIGIFSAISFHYNLVDDSHNYFFNSLNIISFYVKGKNSNSLI